MVSNVFDGIDDLADGCRPFFENRHCGGRFGRHRLEIREGPGGLHDSPCAADRFGGGFTSRGRERRASCADFPNTAIEISEGIRRLHEALAWSAATRAICSAVRLNSSIAVAVSAFVQLGLGRPSRRDRLLGNRTDGGG